MDLVSYLDVAGEKALAFVIKQCGDNGTQVFISGLQPQPLQMLKDAHIGNAKTHVSFIADYETAIKKAEELCILTH